MAAVSYLLLPHEPGKTWMQAYNREQAAEPLTSPSPHSTCHPPS